MKRKSGWSLAGYFLLVTAGMAVMFFCTRVLSCLGMAATILGMYAVEPSGALRRDMTRRVSTVELIAVIGIIGALIVGQLMFPWHPDPKSDDLDWLKSPVKVAVTIALWCLMMATGVTNWRKLDSRGEDQRHAA